MKNVVVIPARAGSKGIKDKNILEFCGKPLLAWSIEQAVRAQNVHEVYVSTDGEEIAKVAREYGAKVIWRPKELALDKSSSEEALVHAVREIEKTTAIKLVVFLQATSPLRRSEDIDFAINELQRKGADSLFSMSVLEDYCIWKDEGELRSWSYDYQCRGRRQERKPLYLENGSIYIFKPSILKSYNNRLGGKIAMYEMPFNQSYEIDSREDIPICEYFMKKLINTED